MRDKQSDPGKALQMRFRPGEGIALALLALLAMWPFWHEHCRGESPLPGSSEPPVAAQRAAASSRDSVEEVQAPSCSGCDELRRLARRLKAREEGAARRFESAANALSEGAANAPSGTAARRQLALALRRAQDDKRGAAAFRTAVLETIRACERGPGCGDVALARHWEGNCPPEHPDLVRETKALAQRVHTLSRKAAACAAAACPEIDCGQHADTIRILPVADRSLAALIGTAVEPSGAQAVGRDGSGDLAALLDETASWRDGVAALFLGGQDPAAQFAAVAEGAGALASRLTAARAEAGVQSRQAHRDPFWRVPVLSARLTGFAEALKALAGTLGSDDPEREAIISEQRRRTADAFRDLLIAQMRIRAAREALDRLNTDAVHRCDRRRRRQIARARGQVRAIQGALSRCAVRAACTERAGKSAREVSVSGLDLVSARRLTLDVALGELKANAGRYAVKPQKSVRLDTVRSRYQAGEAVSVRIDSRATACMADPGAWIGLFAEGAPGVRGAEAVNFAVRRRTLRGRPWEELFFEAPQRPGAYEVRAYTSRLRGGAMAGVAKFAVTPRARGCSGFSGTWRTNFGRLQITVRGGRARGSYKRGGAFRAGFLTGKVKGRVLFGEWQSELGGGGTRLVLSEDGKSFKGTWSHFRDEFAGTGVWRGTCAGPVKERSRATPE